MFSVKATFFPRPAQATRGWQNGILSTSIPITIAHPSCKPKHTGNKKASSTLTTSDPVPHDRTNGALPRLTAEFGRDLVYSWWYGRQRLCTNMQGRTTRGRFSHPQLYTLVVMVIVLSARVKSHRSHFGSRYPSVLWQTCRPFYFLRRSFANFSNSSTNLLVQNLARFL